VVGSFVHRTCGKLSMAWPRHYDAAISS